MALPSDPLPKEQERLLVEHAADGDNESVAQLYDAYEKRLFGYCRRITGNQEDAADATQEAFCNVIQRLPGMDVANLNFGAYLFTAARNACMDILKQQGRFETSDDVPEDPFAVAPLETDPERALLTADQQRAAQEANERLPEKQRTVLAMREVAELSYEDIASALDMNQNSVAQLISRARINFHKQLRAGAVVIPPLDPDAQRAIDLSAARQDGQIGKDDLDWLTAHLAQNESSRINAEAMQESAMLYRAIGPIVVLAGLRDATLARAADATQVSPKSQSQPDVAAQMDAPTRILEPVGAASMAAGAADEAAAGQGESSSNRRRTIYATLACVALLVVLLIATSVGGGSPETSTEQLSDPVQTGATGEPRSGEAPKSEQKKSAAKSEPQQQSQSATNNGTAQTETRSQSGSGKKQKSSDPKNKETGGNPPASSPPADSTPTPPDTPPTEPDPPGGGGGGIPGGPGGICAQPPCTPPPPVP